MKKFLKIVLFGILTLSLINISNTKINYLNNNNEVEKVKSPRKNAYGDKSLINNLTDLSYTEWHQSGNLATDYTYSKYLYSNSDTQVKVCDIINYNNEKQIKEIYTYLPSNDLARFGFNFEGRVNQTLFSFSGSQKNLDLEISVNFFNTYLYIFLLLGCVSLYFSFT